MTRSIDDVRERVSPEWFARVLRPYFEPVTVGGTSLAGPAVANVPITLIDVAVWASDHAGDEYAAFAASPRATPRPSGTGCSRRGCESRRS